MEILLVICLLIAIYIVYITSNRDIMRPSILLMSGYVASIICCLYNKQLWGVDLKGNTVLIIVTGVFSFVIIELFFLLYSYKKNYIVRKEKDSEKAYIKVSDTAIVVCSFICILNIILFISDIVRISEMKFSILNLNEIMHTYRHAYSYGNDKISELTIQVLKFSKGIGYIFLYVFLNNIFVVKPKQRIKEIRYLFPSALFLICTFLLGGRINMIAFAVAASFLSYYNWQKNNNWQKHISIKIIKKIFVFLILLLLIFYFSKNIVGRKTSKTFIDYVTTYVGGSIKLLDEFLNDGEQVIDENNNETFPGIIQTLYKLGIADINPRKSLEFRCIINGEYLGNVYTGLRRFYSDFGYFGLIFIQMMFSFFLNYLYSSIKISERYKHKSIYRTVFYSFTCYCIMIQSIEDHFFINFSVGYLVELIIIYFMVKMIISPNRIQKIGDE